MEIEAILPVAGPVRGRIRPPGSKSITNRALVCAGLAEGRSRLSGMLDSEDTRVMFEALRQLGIKIPQALALSVEIVGCRGEIPARGAELFVANSGTTMRFLTPMVALGQGRFRLDGVARMHERPIQDLIDALAGLGIAARSEAGSGCPPVIVDAQGLRGGATRIRGDVSSQFLSGLLLAAPYAKAPVSIDVEGTLVSKPYVEMTLAVMRAFGASVETTDLQRFEVAQRPYQSREYAIEPDASAASYFWATAAITGGEVTVEGLTRGSLQGDVAFCDCLARMGCSVRESDNGLTVTGGPLRGIDVDMNAISDTVQTLAVVALFAEGPTTITNVAHIRHKETDRIGDLARELRKLGAEVVEREDGLTIHPRPLQGARVATYNDHRMAMSLSLAGLKIPGVEIENPGCTAKTYPGFFADLNRLVRFPVSG